MKQLFFLYVSALCLSVMFVGCDTDITVDNDDVTVDSPVKLEAKNIDVSNIILWSAAN